MQKGSELKKKLTSWIYSMQMKNPWEFKYAPNCPPTMWASAFAALSLAFLGEFENFSKETRTKWIKYLQSFQKEETGFFIDPVFNSKDRLSKNHTDELLFAHSSTFVMGALNRLGAKPLYPIRWTHKYHNPHEMEKWLASLDWHINAWVVGNWSYDIGCALGMDYLVTGKQGPLDGINAYFDWYDRNQNPQTGWWDIANNSPIMCQQYGGYHTLMVYWMFDRPVPKADKMIDTSLALQHQDGLFYPEGGGGCCQDMDCIDPLVNLGWATGYRTNDITKALGKSIEPMLGKYNPDGGVCDNPKFTRAEFGWQLCKAEPGQSDMCSAFFYPFTLILAAEFTKNSQLLDTNWSHLETYCHCVKRKVYLK